MGVAGAASSSCPAATSSTRSADLDGWQYIWVLFWFDRNDGWRPKVLPPRSRSGRKGVFATRSPHRPNPLGLSAVRLERVDGLTLHVSDVDMLDGTPVLDIKPYVAYTDAIADAGSGWLAECGDAPRDPIPAFEVRLGRRLQPSRPSGSSAHGACRCASVRRPTLALGPEPHPYRRIRARATGFTLCIKDWRAVLHGRRRARVRVAAVESGVKPAELARRDEVERGARGAPRVRGAWPPDARRRSGRA